MATLAGQIRARWRVLASLAMVLTMVGLLVLGTLYYQRAQAIGQQNASREAALDASRQVANDLTNIDAATVDPAVRRLEASAAEGFRPELTRQADAIRQVVTQAKVSSQGTITEAALSRSDGATAVALVAAQARVRNAESPDGQQRQYRFRVSLQSFDQRWLVTNLEFVP